MKTKVFMVVLTQYDDMPEILGEELKRTIDKAYYDLQGLKVICISDEDGN